MPNLPPGFRVRSLPEEENISGATGLPPGFQVKSTPEEISSSDGTTTVETNQRKMSRSGDTQRRLVQRAENDSSRSVLPFGNAGIADFVGAPVDLANAALGMVGLDSQQPFGGSQSIRSGMQAVGDMFDTKVVPAPGEKPETLGEHAMYGVGNAGGGLLAGGIVAKGVQALRPVIPVPTPNPSVASRIGKQVVDSFVGTPAPKTAPGAIKFAQDYTQPAYNVGKELIAGGVSGAGGEIAARSFGEDYRGVGEIAAPMSLAAASETARLAAMNNPAVNYIRRSLAPMGKAGAMDAARQRVQGLVANPELARERLRAPGTENLTPVQAIEGAYLDEAGKVIAPPSGLKALENEVVKNNPELRQKRDAAIQIGKEQTEADIRALGEEGNLADTREFIGSRQDKTRRRIDDKIAEVNRRADEAVSKLSPGQDATSASLQVREEIGKALDDVVTARQEAWAEVPVETKSGTENFVGKYNSLKADLSSSEAGDMPEVAQNMMTRLTDPDTGEVAVEETVRELQGLRHKLLQEQSNALSDIGKRNGNRARIAGALADAVLEDLGAVSGKVSGEAGEKLRKALDISRKEADLFKKGTVGRILGIDRAGGLRTPANETLSTTMAGGKERGATALSDISATSQTGEMQAGLQDYVLNQFNRKAVKNSGEFDPNAAQGFLRDNKGILDKFPEVRGNIETAIAEQRSATSTAGRLESTKADLSNPKKSATAVFSESGYGKEVKNMVNSPKPGEAAAAARRTAMKDESGKAIRGLRQGVVDHVLSKVTASDGTIDGKGLLKMVNGAPNPEQAVLLNTLDTNGMNKLRRIAQIAAKEDVRALEGGVGSITEGTETALFKLLKYQIGTEGAIIGGKLVQGRGGGAGASFRAASKGSKLAEWVSEKLGRYKVEELISRALVGPDGKGDKELMELLLSNPGEGLKLKKWQDRLSAWAEGVARRKTPAMTGAGANAFSSPSEEESRQ